MSDQRLQALWRNFRASRDPNLIPNLVSLTVRSGRPIELLETAPILRLEDLPVDPPYLVVRYMFHDEEAWYEWGLERKDWGDPTKLLDTVAAALRDVNLDLPREDVSNVEMTDSSFIIDFTHISRNEAKQLADGLNSLGMSKIAEVRQQFAKNVEVILRARLPEQANSLIEDIAMIGAIWGDIDEYEAALITHTASQLVNYQAPVFGIDGITRALNTPGITEHNAVFRGRTVAQIFDSVLEAARRSIIDNIHNEVIIAPGEVEEYSFSAQEMALAVPALDQITIMGEITQETGTFSLLIDVRYEELGEGVVGLGVRLLRSFPNLNPLPGHLVIPGTFFAPRHILVGVCDCGGCDYCGSHCITGCASGEGDSCPLGEELDD